MDDLLVGKNFTDFLASVIEFRKNVTCEDTIDHAAVDEEIENLLVVHDVELLSWKRIGVMESIEVCHGDMNDLLGRCQASENLTDAVLAHGAHTHFTGALAQL